MNYEVLIGFGLATAYIAGICSVFAFEYLIKKYNSTEKPE